MSEDAVRDAARQAIARHLARHANGTAAREPRQAADHQAFALCVVPASFLMGTTRYARPSA